MKRENLHGMWAIQSGRKLGLPYCYLLCGSVVLKLFIGPGCERRARQAVGPDRTYTPDPYLVHDQHR